MQGDTSDVQEATARDKNSGHGMAGGAGSLAMHNEPLTTTAPGTTNHPIDGCPSLSP